MVSVRRSRQADALPLGRSDEGGRATLFFCLRADSDVDHIVPVIDAVARRGLYGIRVIVYDPLKTYRDDYRFRYLRARHGLAAKHLMELPGVDRLRRLQVTLLRVLFHGLLTVQRRVAWWPVARLLHSALLRLNRVLKALCARPEATAALVAEVERSRGGAVIFDHSVHPMAETVTAAARRRGLMTLALPHSVPHLTDLPRDAVVGPEDAGELDWGALYDRVILPNAPTAARFSADCRDAGVLAILGSARFSQGWGAVLDGIAPRVDWHPGGTKVLFILSKNGPYVDWGEVNRVTARLCSDPRLAVCLKPHPRTEVSGLPAVEHGRRVTIAAAEMPTSSLIHWADLVVFWGSSVIYDALRLRKPVLHLGYLFRLRFDFEPFLQSWGVGSFEEFSRRLDAFVEHGGPTYSEAEAAACMAALVEPAGEPAPERYATFIEDLLDSSGSDRAEIAGRGIPASGKVQSL